MKYRRGSVLAFMGFFVASMAPLAAQDCDVLPSIQLRNAATAGTMGFADITSKVPLVDLLYDLQITGGLPSAPGCIAISTIEDPVAFPEFGATLYPSLAASVIQVFDLDASGDSPLLLQTHQIPDYACSGTIIVQGAFLDPGAVGGVAITDALVIRFGRTQGPLLNPVTSPTQSLVATISGVGDAEGDRIIVQGGAMEVETMVGPGRMFSVDVPLNDNQLNRLFVTEELAPGQFSPAARADIVQDLTGPALFINFPGDGDTIFDIETDVFGVVNDALSGLQDLVVTVDVNGQPFGGSVAVGQYGTFSAIDVPLQVFSPAADATNVITVQATDAVGNQTTRTATVDQAPLPAALTVEEVSGNHQEGTVNTGLVDPIVVKVTGADGMPVAGKIVNFTVTAGDDLLFPVPAPEGIGGGVGFLQVATDASGLAPAGWQLGSESGSGNHLITVTSEGSSGDVTFSASAIAGDAEAIVADGGEGQAGRTGTEAETALVVFVNDGCNGVAGTPVTFTITSGGGGLSGDEKSLVVNVNKITVLTDATGHAAVSLFLGPNPGLNTIEATFPDNPGLPVVFTAFALATDLPAARFSGLVQDNSHQPVEGATVTLGIGVSAPLSTTTDAGGSFAFESLTGSGLASLSVDGGTATAVGGVPVNPATLAFPTLKFSPFIIPNADNSLPSPVLLPRLVSVNERVFDNTADVELSVAGISGFSILVPAGTTVRHPDGTLASEMNPIELSLDQVHAEDLFMPLPNGAGAPFAWTLEPRGATFDPPAKITFPNMDGLPPGLATSFVSFDPRIRRFQTTARGRVSSDGSRVVSDPGQGIIVSGFTAVTPPFLPTGAVRSAMPTTLPVNTVVRVGGRSQRIGSDGFITINNIAARPDQFPVEATVRSGTETLFGRSPAVALAAGMTTPVGDIALSPTPPNGVVSIAAEPDQDLLTPASPGTQLRVLATFSDGTMADVSMHSQGCSYRTSNPTIATVDPDGFVTAISNGTAFITARNEGATAVARLDVDFGDPLTTASGLVVLPDGTPAVGATVQASGTSDLTADVPAGFFALPGLPSTGPITVAASLATPDGVLTGRSDPAAPVPGGITDVGVIVLHSAKALVVSSSTNSVSVVDPGTFSVDSTVTLSQGGGHGIGDVRDVVVSPDGKTALVTRTLFSVVMLSLETDPPAVVGTIPVPTLAEDIDLACTSTGYAVISTRAGGGFLLPLVSVDLQTRQVVDTLHMSGGPQGVTVTPDGSLALINSAAGDAVRVISIGPGGSLSDTGQSIPFTRPQNITISPDGTIALVAGPSEVGVLSIDFGLVTLVGSIPIGESTQSIAFTPDGRSAYAFHSQAGTVSVLAVDEFMVTDTGTRIPVTPGATSLGVDQVASTAAGDRVLVHSSDVIHVIDTATDTVIGSISVPGDTEGGGLARIR